MKSFKVDVNCPDDQLDKVIQYGCHVDCYPGVSWDQLCFRKTSKLMESWDAEVIVRKMSEHFPNFVFSIEIFQVGKHMDNKKLYYVAGESLPHEEVFPNFPNIYHLKKRIEITKKLNKQATLKKT